MVKMKQGFGFKGGATTVALVHWETKRVAKKLTRHAGIWGWGGLICLFLSVAACIVITLEKHRIGLLKIDVITQATQVAKTRATRPTGTPKDDNRVRLKAFEDVLPAYEAIPGIVAKLLEQASQQKLQIMRGEYKPQMNNHGQFLRYQMTLPVKGNAQAIHRFMALALKNEATLALESVEFKREQLESSEVEAHIQWLLFTKTPQRIMTGASGPSARASQ